VIPAYDEESRILPTLQKVAGFARQGDIQTEIIVVDDGSTDRTAELVGEFSRGNRQVSLLINPHRGKGYAVKTGMLAARGRFVLFTDADLATPIEESSKLLAALEAGSDLAIGNRIQPTGYDMRASQPLYRRLLGRLYHLLARNLAVRGIADTQCGFKGFSHSAAQRLFSRQRLDGIVFDTEILYLAQRNHLRIAQIPVSWSNVGGSRMRPSIGRALGVLWDLLRIRWLHLWG
jgi:dolichyl-phosphate beta-glucosyltransferase